MKASLVGGSPKAKQSTMKLGDFHELFTTTKPAVSGYRVRGIDVWLISLIIFVRYITRVVASMGKLSSLVNDYFVNS